MNFFHRFLGLAQNHAQSCRMVKKGEIYKNTQFYIVKLSFFDVKTDGKLTFFIIFWMNTILHYSSCKYSIYLVYKL